MATPIGEGVSLRGFYSEDWNFTWNISGAAVRADVGKVMAQDTATKNTAKLAGDGDLLIGKLSSYENRVQEGVIVGTISHKGSFEIPYTGALTLGASVVGSATPGVAKAAAAGSNPTRVVELLAGNLAVVMFS